MAGEVGPFPSRKVQAGYSTELPSRDVLLVGLNRAARWPEPVRVLDFFVQALVAEVAVLIQPFVGRFRMPEAEGLRAGVAADEFRLCLAHMAVVLVVLVPGVPRSVPFLFVLGG